MQIDGPPGRGDESPREDYFSMVPVSMEKPSPRRDSSLYDSGSLSIMHRHKLSAAEGEAKNNVEQPAAKVERKEKEKEKGEPEKDERWKEKEMKRISARMPHRMLRDDDGGNDGGMKGNRPLLPELSGRDSDKRTEPDRRIDETNDKADGHRGRIISDVGSGYSRQHRKDDGNETASDTSSSGEGTRQPVQEKGKQKDKTGEGDIERVADSHHLASTSPEEGRRDGRHFEHLRYYQASSDELVTRNRGSPSTRRKKVDKGIVRFRRINSSNNTSKEAEWEDKSDSDEEDEEGCQLRRGGSFEGNPMSNKSRTSGGHKGLLTDSEEIVKINVGGFRYTTTRSTLLGRGRGDNFFMALLGGRYPVLKDQTGAYFIDRDGQYFAPILTYMRTGVTSIPHGMPLEAVKREAEFFNLQPLVRSVDKLMKEREMATADITKAEFFQCLTMARIKGFMLSMAGMKMRGIDFSHMQLLNVHFSSCDLEGANFTNAILNKAQFHAANLKNVKFVHSIFSSHTNPFSRTTNLEGVLFHQTDHALSLYGQSFKEWGYKMENVSLSLYGISFKELGYQMENVNTEFFCKNIIRLVKRDEAELEKERDRERSNNENDDGSAIH